MRRDATGQLVAARRAKGTVWGLRFRTAAGERVYKTLGRSWEGMDRRAAQKAADDLLAQARLGIYRSPAERERERAERDAKRIEDPPFETFAEEWFKRRCDLGGRTGKGLSTSGRADLRNILDQHLLPWFTEAPLGTIDVREVEAYAAAKLRRDDDDDPEHRDGRIGPTYLNKTLATLRAIFRDALRYGLIARNPAEGVRVASVRFKGSALETPAQIAALLDAAGELDRERGRRTVPYRRALLATLTFAGLRHEEALELRWRDVDLAAARMSVHGTKSPDADRTMHILPVLRDELAALKAARDPKRDERVFGTSTGGKDSQSNVRRRVLARAVEKANERLAKEDAGELPDRITPNSLRRTYCSLMYARGAGPDTVMDEMGHTDPNLALKVYRKAMRRGEAEKVALRALVEGTATTIPDTAPMLREAA